MRAILVETVCPRGCEFLPRRILVAPGEALLAHNQNVNGMDESRFVPLLLYEKVNDVLASVELKLG